MPSQAAIRLPQRCHCAVAYAARKGGGRKRPAAGWASLTPAEREVVRLAGEGLRNEAIARQQLAAQAAAQDLTATSSDELTHAPRRAAIRGRSQPQPGVNRLTP